MRFYEWTAPFSRTGLIVIATAIAVTSGVALAVEPSGMLSGDQEVPQVVTSASATSNIVVGSDMSVSGGVETSGMQSTAAHIHEGATGTNGPVLVTLIRKSATGWSVPDGTKFTPAQYASFKAGKLYVNVHSAAHEDGEIRLQLSP
jgi:hypothetical protein